MSEAAEEAPVPSEIPPGAVETAHKPPAPLAGFMRWPGVLGAFVWGVAEGTLFFIIPDVIVTLAALLGMRRSLWHLSAVIAGALVAGAGMYLWSAADPIGAQDAVSHVPAVQPWMFDRVQEDFRAAGIWGPCRGPMSGVPYKVFAVVAPQYCGLAAFLSVSIPARLERLLVTWVLFGAAGGALRRWKPQWLRVALWIHPVYWLVVELVYWISLA